MAEHIVCDGREHLGNVTATCW